jgi:radical SAM superfamily enzyme YgiQ (UPF0313 family)
MRALLVSTYELGHQPLHVASPAAALLRAGHQVRAIDLAVESWPEMGPAALAWTDAVAYSVPMHTAMRLALQHAREVRRMRPDVAICFYGLYAAVSHDLTVGTVADQVIAGEYEPSLVSWVDRLERGGGPSTRTDLHRPVRIELAPSSSTLPARHLLPPLERYAHLAVGEELHTAGYVEASHGCSHRCRHCPVPVVYQGRTRPVDEELVVADVAQLAAMGAAHITIGDPDFLNRPLHAQRVVQAVHAAFPQLSFDVTTKVEHILRHETIWPELARAGCLFVVSAFESVNDAVLASLAKGHTVADEVRALSVVREAGIELRPSFLPFTPWTTPAHLVDLVEFVAAYDLVPSVDAVQYSIRLLLPEGSLLLDSVDLAPYLGSYDNEALSYGWHAAEPTLNALQAELAHIAQSSVETGQPVEETYEAVRAAVLATAGLPYRTAGSPSAPWRAAKARPRLTEPWFCCAEPTDAQRLGVTECATTTL